MSQVLTRPSILLRIEGGAVFVASLIFYWQRGDNWLLFVLLLLAPDLAALGYLAGTRVGAATYNFVHTYVPPIALATYGLLSEASRGPGSLAVTLALIWFAHIGMDRLLGFGLKYPTEFKDTHLSHV